MSLGELGVEVDRTFHACECRVEGCIKGRMTRGAYAPEVAHAAGMPASD